MPPAPLPDRRHWARPRAWSAGELGGYARPLFAALLLLPLLVDASVGSFTRYAADDYCTAGVVRTHGLLAAQGYWYTGFSPRFTFTFLVSLAELAGPAIVPLLPAAALVAWLLALTWTISRFANLLPSPRSLAASVLLAELLVFGTLNTTPDIGQSLYWQTGMLTYLFPLILLTLYVGWVARSVSGAAPGRAAPLALGVSAALTFFAGGLSETYLAGQAGVIGLAALGCLAGRRTSIGRLALPHLLAGLLGSLACLVVLSLSPAIPGRVTGLQLALPAAAEASVKAGLFFVARWVRHSFFTALLCLGLPAVLGIESASREPAPPRHLLPVGGAVLLALLGCFLPAFYALGADPPARALIVPDFLLVAGLTYAGVALAPRLRRLLSGIAPQAPAVALAGLALVPLVAAGATLPRRAGAADYAAQWDAEDRQIRAARAAGATNLVVPPLPPNLGESFVGPDPQDWFNRCVARYYRLASIAAR